ncbi:hypothetical protein BRADI_3g46805v3 [Brachypodium distachyon]|uniref:Uncharacterized protein n=1 Tax=Brachypodium distachyon TaxID=15368 RepID=A0A0Q3I2D9_BRADI|nr:hypothetical protein BRADI_3g46805v3 [Brachypodium distachyon]
MGVHCDRLAILAMLVLLASVSEAFALRSLGVFAQANGANISPATQPRELTERNAAPAAARFDVPEKHTAATVASSSTVFDPDRMSKRRVRRGSDPIHNKC